MVSTMTFLLALTQAIPTGGIQLVAPDNLALQGNAKYGTVQQVSVTGQPFTKAARVSTTQIPGNEWEFEVGTNVLQPVQKGDTLFATVYVRAIKGQPETGEGRTTLDFQTNGGDWSKSVSQPISITKTWQKIQVPFTAGYTTAANGANVAFRLGYGVQIVEIGGLSILNFGTKVKLGQLPRTAIHYAGEEPNAQWRKDALARIEKIRKAPLTVQVTDAKGRPIKGALVTVKMTKQSFPFGTAVAADQLFQNTADTAKFKDILVKDFNRATIENNLKWPFWETWGRADGLKAVDWLNNHGLTVRAHNVIWPSYRNSPDDLKNLSNDELKTRIDKHIVDVVTAVKGKVDVWDVVNEPFDNHDITDRLGKASLADWFRRVKQLDPKPRLVLNDYPPLDGAATTNPHLNSFYQNISDLKAARAPIEGIGFQAHIGGEPIPPQRILSGLDRFAKLGLPIEITEFDINSQDQEYQAHYIRDFMIAIYSHPSVNGFTQWGFWSKRHWLPDAALYDASWNLKPVGRAYLDLAKKAWWTNANGSTNIQGTYQTRGFLGQYTVTVTVPGKPSRTIKTVLSKGSPTLTVKF